MYKCQVIGGHVTSQPHPPTNKQQQQQQQQQKSKQQQKNNNKQLPCLKFIIKPRHFHEKKDKY